MGGLSALATILSPFLHSGVDPQHTNFIERFARVGDVQLVEAPLDFENLLGVNVNVCCLALRRNRSER